MIYEYSPLDLLPYLLLFAILLFLYSKKDSKHETYYLIAIVLFVFSAIRYSTGWDYYGYLNDIIYNDTDRYEFLVKELIKFAHNTDYKTFFAITSFLVIFPLSIGCKKLSRDPELSLIVYALVPQFYVYSFSVIRNAVAWSFIFCAYALFREKRYFYTVLLFIASLGFHISALVSLPIFILSLFKIGKHINYLIFLLSFLLSSMFGEYIERLTFEDTYFSRMVFYVDGKSSGGGMMKWAINFIGLFFLLQWDRISIKRKENAKLLTIVIVGVSLWNLFYGINNTLAIRFSVSYMLFLILLVPELLYCYERISRKMIMTMIITFFFMFSASSFYINIVGNLANNGKMSQLPYLTIFNPIDYNNIVY